MDPEQDNGDDSHNPSEVNAGTESVATHLELSMDVDAAQENNLSSLDAGGGKQGAAPVADRVQSRLLKLASGEVADEEDESHLPPGVRRKNRCHSSSSNSSSGSDADAKKKKNVEDHSDTDSDSSDNEKKVEKKEKTTPEEQEPEENAKKSKARSVSKSRSRSPSPRSKHRRSSERSGKRSRSRSRDRRHHRREKKSRRRSSSGSRRRSSRDRDHHKRKRRDRSRDRRRSRSRDRKRDRSRSRSRDRDRRDRHRRDRGSRRSRDRRSRSRSRSPSGSAKVIKIGDKVIKAGASFGRPPSSKPMTFKEKMRQQFIKAMEEGGDAAQALTNKDGTVMCTQTAGIQQMNQLQQAPAKLPAPVPLMANLVQGTASLQAATISASEAAMQSMLQLQKETEEKTGVEIPKYYNPAAINPVKYAEQVQKRKLLWSKTKDKDVNSQWTATNLSGEHDDKSKEKFRKLMGIKHGEVGSSEVGEEKHEATEEEQQKELKQKELFDQLDKEYQFARMATHTHRGIGLGFGSAAGFQPPPS